MWLHFDDEESVKKPQSMPSIISWEDACVLFTGNTEGVNNESGGRPDISRAKIPPRKLSLKAALAAIGLKRELTDAQKEAMDIERMRLARLKAAREARIARHGAFRVHLEEEKEFFNKHYISSYT